MNSGKAALLGRERFPERDSADSPVANTLNSWKISALSHEGRDLGDTLRIYNMLLALNFFSKPGASLSHGTLCFLPMYLLSLGVRVSLCSV